MRAIFAVLLLVLAGCEAEPPHSLRLVTLEHPHSSGVSLRELPSAALESMGLAYGLAVVRAGSAAERAGLRVGDVVYGVNRMTIGSLEDFSRLVAQHGGGNVGLLVRRGKSDFLIAIDLDGDPPPRGLPRRGWPARDTLLRT